MADPVESTEHGKYKLFGCCDIACLQRLNNSKVYLFFHCLFGILASALSVGSVYISSGMLRRRFGLSDFDVTLILVAYDAGFPLSAIFAAYFGSRHNRAKQAVIGMVIYILGGILFVLPHFTTGLYTYEKEKIKLTCSPDLSRDCSIDRTDLRYAFYLFFVGLVLMGAGTAVFLVLGLTYIDDSVSMDYSSIYLALANAASNAGVAVGLSSGMKLNEIYVDFYRTKTTLSFRDLRFIGAWWFFPATLLAFAVVLVMPLLGYPKYLPDMQRRMKKVNKELDSQFEKQEYPDARLLKQLFLLITNRTFMLLTFSRCFQTFLFTGINRLLPKIFESIYYLERHTSVYFAGAISLLAEILGNISGGLLIHIFECLVPAILKLNAGVLLLSAGLSASFLFYCDNVHTAGIDHKYGVTESDTRLEFPDLLSSCNSACKCQEEFFSPVCGLDNVTYFSPCHAGCNETITSTTYGKCKCVHENLPMGFSNYSATRSGPCAHACTKSINFIVLSLPLLTALSFCYTPAMVASLRIVPHSLKSLALAIQLSLIHALGHAPGPYLFERFAEATCLYRKKYQCDGTEGKCLIYNNQMTSIIFMTITIAGSLLAMILVLGGLYLYKPVILTDANDHKSRKSNMGKGKKSDQDTDRRKMPNEDKLSVSNEILNFQQPTLKQKILSTVSRKSAKDIPVKSMVAPDPVQFTDRNSVLRKISRKSAKDIPIKSNVGKLSVSNEILNFQQPTTRQKFLNAISRKSAKSMPKKSNVAPDQATTRKSVLGKISRKSPKDIPVKSGIGKLSVSNEILNFQQPTIREKFLSTISRKSAKNIPEKSNVAPDQATTRKSVLGKISRKSAKDIPVKSNVGKLSVSNEILNFQQPTIRQKFLSTISRKSAKNIPEKSNVAPDQSTTRKSFFQNTFRKSTKDKPVQSKDSSEPDPYTIKSNHLDKLSHKSDKETSMESDVPSTSNESTVIDNVTETTDRKFSKATSSEHNDLPNSDQSTVATNFVNLFFRQFSKETPSQSTDSSDSTQL